MVPSGQRRIPYQGASDPIKSPLWWLRLFAAPWSQCMVPDERYERRYTKRTRAKPRLRQQLGRLLRYWSSSGSRQSWGKSGRCASSRRRSAPCCTRGPGPPHTWRSEWPAGRTAGISAAGPNSTRRAPDHFHLAAILDFTRRCGGRAS